MKIELKSIKYAAFASEETSCYNASLWVDGKKIGHVANEGHGGPDSFHGDQAAFQKADEWCKANLPKWEGYDGKMLDTDLEMQCGNLLDTFLVTRDLKTAMRTKILFRKPDGGIYEMKHKKQPDAAIAAIKRDHPQAEILNSMPLEFALAIFRSNPN